MNIVYVSGQARPGFENEYNLAIKHRHVWAWLYNRTPWWQLKKKKTRFKGWLFSIQNFHKYGEDKIANV